MWHTVSRSSSLFAFQILRLMKHISCIVSLVGVFKMTGDNPTVCDGINAPLQMDYFQACVFIGIFVKGKHRLDIISFITQRPEERRVDFMRDVQ